MTFSLLVETGNFNNSLGSHYSYHKFDTKTDRDDYVVEYKRQHNGCGTGRDFTNFIFVTYDREEIHHHVLSQPHHVNKTEIY